MSIVTLIFAVMVLAPWMLLTAAIRVAKGRKVQGLLVLLWSLAYLALGTWVFWDAMYVHTDPQGGLVFLIVPILASLFVGALLGLLVLLAMRQAGREKQAPDAS